MNNYIHSLILIVLTIGILAILNIAGGLYYNIGKKGMEFDKKKLYHGIAKTIIVVAIIAGLTYVWLVYTELGIVDETLIDPYIICYLTSIYYFAKVCTNLIKIFGIEEAIKKKLGE
ncbi:MAG: hypothetical protein RR565_09620 [Erysipelothrix sp.]